MADSSDISNMLMMRIISTISKNEKLVYNEVAKVIQFVLWLLIIDYLFCKEFILLTIVYVIYIILALSSPYLRLLLNRQSYESLKVILNDLRQARPACKIIVGYTNTLTRINLNKIKENYEQWDSRAEDFEFITWLDISDKFTPKRQINKEYLKLFLELKVYFADQPTESANINQSTRLGDKIGSEVNNKTIKQDNSIKNMKKEYLITLSEYDSNHNIDLIYVLMSFLGVVEIYKFYFDNICIKQEYEIKKVISSTYDLSLPEYKNNWVKEQNDIISIPGPIIEKNQNSFYLTENIYEPKPLFIEDLNEPKSKSENIYLPNPIEDDSVLKKSLKIKAILDELCNDKKINLKSELMVNYNQISNKLNIENKNNPDNKNNSINVFKIDAAQSIQVRNANFVENQNEEANVPFRIKSNKTKLSKRFRVDINTNMHGDSLIRRNKSD